MKIDDFYEEFDDDEYADCEECENCGVKCPGVDMRSDVEDEELGIYLCDNCYYNAIKVTII